MENANVQAEISLADMDWDNIKEVEPTMQEKIEIAEAEASGLCNEKETAEVEAILNGVQ